MVTSCEEHSKLMIIEKLVSIEEILITILARLPPTSIFRFKCVSKTWKRILVEPFFLETYYKAARARNKRVVVGYNGERLLAFIKSGIVTSGSSYRFPYADTLTLSQKKHYVNRLVPARFGHICHSYNGLILCQDSNTAMIFFYIVNPLTRMCVTLPPKPGIYQSSSSGLTWEENTHNLVPSYKVVQAYLMKDPKEKNKVVIDTYCSKSGKWEESTLIARENLNIISLYSPLLVSNGVFYWYTERTEPLMVYDSNRDEKHVQLIKRPTSKDLESLSGATMSSCDGVLWYGSNSARQDWREPKINFWILPKDKLYESYKYATTIEENEWILMHTICVQSFYNDLNAKFVRDAVVNNIKPSDLFLLGWIPCYPVLAVLSNIKNVFLYNLESKCVELVPHRPSSDIDTRLSFRLIPYVESLSLSSYVVSTTSY